MVRPFVVVVVSEASWPLFRAGLTIAPERVKEVNSHGHSLEPLFDVVPNPIVELTAQFVARNDRQIAATIDEKFCVGDIVFLGGSM